MKFGVIGLGRIGGSLALQALGKGAQVVGFNRSPESTRELAKHGLQPAFSLDELVAKLVPPRIVMIYVPHGAPTEEVLANLKSRASKGDILVDGGNSNWKDSIRHYDALRASGIQFLDAGTSGGIEGARHGACFMVGGDEPAFATAEPVFSALAVPGGVVHAGPPGAGHFCQADS